MARRRTAGVNHGDSGESGRNVSCRSPARSAAHFYFPVWRNRLRRRGRRARHLPGAHGPQRRRADASPRAPSTAVPACPPCQDYSDTPHSAVTSSDYLKLKCTFRRAKAEIGSPISGVVQQQRAELSRGLALSRGSAGSVSQAGSGASSTGKPPPPPAPEPRPAPRTPPPGAPSGAPPHLSLSSLYNFP